MSIYTSILTGGSNNHETTSEAANATQTDLIGEGVVGAITNTGGVAPATGAFAVNAQGTPAMAVDVSAGLAYVTATPTGQNSQNLRVRNTATEEVVIEANSTGSTKYDWIYLAIDATNAANPAVDGDDVASLVVSRSTSNSSDDGTPPTYAIPLAVVTVANGASSITNGNITDARGNITVPVASVDTAQLVDGAVETAKIADGAVTPSKLGLQPQTDTVATSQTTSSASYTDLATAGPAVTVDIGENGLALVSLYATLDSGTVGNRPNMAFAVSGANTMAATSSMSVQGVAASGATQQRMGATFLLTGLNPGSTTFTAKYERQSGTGDSIFANRVISVIPL